jgi:hypothetical protein
MGSTTLSPRQLGRATLARQGLLDREKVPVPEAVERFGGLQAQEPRPPFAGLWSRVAGFGREDLHAALHAREVVRVTSMRATLHVMSARDYAALRASLAPMLEQTMRSFTKALDVDRVLAAARVLLEEKPRTFNELRSLLADEFPDANERALGAAVRVRLPLVMVPTEDRWGFPRDSRFALAEDWLDEPLSEDRAPERLVRRYLAAFGPATAADVQAWSGLKGIKAVMEELRPDLESFEDERGRELFDLPDAPRPDGDAPAPARLLPDFDSLVLAHADRTRVIDDEHRALIATKNLRIRATFLVDGRVRGTWSVERRGKKAALLMAPFERLRKRDAAALAEEGDALVRFLEDDAASFDVKVR